MRIVRRLAATVIVAAPWLALVGAGVAVSYASWWTVAAVGTVVGLAVVVVAIAKAAGHGSLDTMLPRVQDGPMTSTDTQPVTTPATMDLTLTWGEVNTIVSALGLMKAEARSAIANARTETERQVAVDAFGDPDDLERLIRHVIRDRH